ncbi:MAG: hypothetical protein QNJ72_28900 [Pleurocapsa sp. MO_226.B13]|nr:hypothetical protein [Pleurocapsa sp. MO_226.B13]
MNLPKYKKGDRVGSWKISHVYFADWLNTWVYKLQLRHGKKKTKLTCTENILVRID